MVQAEALAWVLRPWLGAAFLSSSSNVCASACALLNGFDTLHGDLGVLYSRLDSFFFHQVHDLTRGDMRILLDDGRVIRMRVDDVDQMADDVLYLPLRELPRTVEQYERLRGFAMTHESLSALRALYIDFTSFQTEDELRLIARTARECHPEYRWRAWLPQDG